MTKFMPGVQDWFNLLEWEGGGEDNIIISVDTKDKI